MSSEPIHLEDQIKCVEREIAMRERVYPRWVSAGKMEQEKAEYEIRAMQEVLSTLRAVDALRASYLPKAV